MVEEDRSELLSRVLAEALEEGAFVFSGPAEAAPCWDGGELLEAILDLGQPAVFRLRLVATRALAGELAANMLGVEDGDELSCDLACDALAEMLNLVAGSVVAASGDDIAAAAIGVPLVNELADPYAVAEADSSANAVLETEHGSCLIDLIEL